MLPWNLQSLQLIRKTNEFALTSNIAHCLFESNQKAWRVKILDNLHKMFKCRFDNAKFTISKVLMSRLPIKMRQAADNFNNNNVWVATH